MKVEYIVDKKNRVVIAKLIDNNLNISDIFSRINIVANFKYNYITKDDIVKHIYEYTFKGVARCFDKDEFDIEKGKKIARRKALIKRNKAIIKQINKFIEDKHREILGAEKLIDDFYNHNYSLVDEIEIIDNAKKS